MLINSASIETMLVAHSRREADEKLQDLGHGVAWTSDAYTVERFRYVSSHDASPRLELITRFVAAEEAVPTLRPS